MLSFSHTLALHSFSLHFHSLSHTLFPLSLSFLSHSLSFSLPLSLSLVLALFFYLSISTHTCPIYTQPWLLFLSKIHLLSDMAQPRHTWESSFEVRFFSSSNIIAAVDLKFSTNEIITTFLSQLTFSLNQTNARPKRLSIRTTQTKTLLTPHFSLVLALAAPDCLLMLALTVPRLHPLQSLAALCHPRLLA